MLIKRFSQKQYLVTTGFIVIDAKIEQFGSSANGFSSYKSDLDICLALPQVSMETVCYVHVPFLWLTEIMMLY